MPLEEPLGICNLVECRHRESQAPAGFWNQGPQAVAAVCFLLLGCRNAHRLTGCVWLLLRVRLGLQSLQHLTSGPSQSSCQPRWMPASRTCPPAHSCYLRQAKDPTWLSLS